MPAASSEKGLSNTPTIPPRMPRSTAPGAVISSVGLNSTAPPTPIMPNESNTQAAATTLRPVVERRLAALETAPPIMYPTAAITMRPKNGIKPRNRPATSPVASATPTPVRMADLYSCRPAVKIGDGRTSAQVSQRAPTGVIIKHCGQIGVSQRPQRSPVSTSGCSAQRVTIDPELGSPPDAVIGADDSEDNGNLASISCLKRQSVGA